MIQVNCYYKEPLLEDSLQHDAVQ